MKFYRAQRTIPICTMFVKLPILVGRLLRCIPKNYLRCAASPAIEGRSFRCSNYSHLLAPLFSRLKSGPPEAVRKRKNVLNQQCCEPPSLNRSLNRVSARSNAVYKYKFSIYCAKDATPIDSNRRIVIAPPRHSQLCIDISWYINFQVK